MRLTAHFRATSSFSECTSGFSTTKCVAVLGFTVLLPFMPEQRMMSKSRLRCDQPSPGPAFNCHSNRHVLCRSADDGTA